MCRSVSADLLPVCELILDCHGQLAKSEVIFMHMNTLMQSQASSMKMLKPHLWKGDILQHFWLLMLNILLQISICRSGAVLIYTACVSRVPQDGSWTSLVHAVFFGNSSFPEYWYHPRASTVVHSPSTHSRQPVSSEASISFSTSRDWTFKDNTVVILASRTITTCSTSKLELLSYRQHYVIYCASPGCKNYCQP